MAIAYLNKMAAQFSFFFSLEIWEWHWEHHIVPHVKYLAALLLTENLTTVTPVIDSFCR